MVNIRLILSGVARCLNFIHDRLKLERLLNPEVIGQIVNKNGQ